MKELAIFFLRLGTTAFGGPAAHIAMMEDEVVKRRGWMSHEYFLDLLGATNLIPGPNSTEMAIHIGYVRGGIRGLVLAGVCFIAPAVVITLVFARLYSVYGALPQLQPFVFGIHAAIIAVIAGAVFRLAKPAIKKPFVVLVGVVVTMLSIYGVDALLLLIGAGIAGVLWYYRTQLIKSAAVFGIVPFVGALFTMFGEGSRPETTQASLSSLGLFFLKIGSILYGSGYVLVAFLQGGLVDTRHWLTQTQLLDAVAVGQFTPGPVLSTATFIGYLILGIPGATVATVGIFLPSFVFVLISSPFIPRLRSSPLARGFLDGVNAAALGLMLGVTVLLATSTLTSVAAWVIFLLAGVIVVVWNINAAWIVMGSAGIGWIVSLLTK
jgi:chromate transporter